MNSCATTWTVALVLASACAPTPSPRPEGEPDPEEMASGGDPSGTGGSGGVGASVGGSVVGTGASASEDLLPILEVHNPTDSARPGEVIEIGIEEFEPAHPELFAPDGTLGATRAFDENGQELPTQLMDLDEDGSAESLLVQLDLGSKETRRIAFDAQPAVETIPGVHARFVPERLDDFAWENDKTIYRTYGPALATSGQTSGSGIDVWVKSTPELVLDEWYALDDYHVDHGEGLDAYQVGTTRGAGGTALFTGEEFVSAGVFAAWKILATGPIRVVFELQYEGIAVGDGVARESKRFSLDKGSWWTRVETSFSGEASLAQARPAVGIAVHAEAITQVGSGAIRVWEPLDGDNGFVGVAVVAEGDVSSSEEDGHLFLTSAVPGNEPFVFHIGSAWSKASVPDAASFDALKETLVTRSTAPVMLSWSK